MNDVLYVILNGSLNMSPGKAAAQAVHAAMSLATTHRINFVANKRRTVIVLEAKDREQMDGICDYLFEASIDFERYIDEGVNEVQAFSMTAIAVEPFSADDTQKREIFAGLSLYHGNTDGDEKACSDDYEDDCCDTEAPYDVPYNISHVQRQLSEVIRKLTPEPPKLKWYQKLFKKKQSWVS